MVFFNYALRKLNAKIVFYGPGLCGKTTNLQWIHDHFEGGQRGRMISLATEGDRTIFFDLLPLDIGTIRGMQVTLQLYTVPGQVHYNSTRQLVLKGADGVVFVADSQRAMLKSNQDSWRNLQENLLLQGIELRSFPHVLQFNKRDLRDIMSIEDLDAFLNQYDAPIFEAVATDGVGVQESLEGIVKLVMRSLKERYEPVVSGAPGPPQPAVGAPQTPPAWPSISAPSATRPAPPPAPPPKAPPPPAPAPPEPSFSHPIDVDTDAVGVTTRQLSDEPDEPEPHTDETPTLVSEAESLEEEEVVVPPVVPGPEPDEVGVGTDTATGPELFADDGFGDEGGEPSEAGTPHDDPTAISKLAEGDDAGADWLDEDRPAAAASWDAEAEEEPFSAPADEPPLEEQEPFTAEASPADTLLAQEAAAGEYDQPESWGDAPEGWSAERPPQLEPAVDESDEIEPDFELVAEDPAPAGSGDGDMVVESIPDRGAEPAVTMPTAAPGEPFFVSDEEPFGELLEPLRDEPTATREVTAEGSALVAAPSARVSSVDVLPDSNQLHVRLHGHGALAEYGQVREMDIVVPVPGQWIGNQRVTLQLRLTLTPTAEDEGDEQG